MTFTFPKLNATEAAAVSALVTYAQGEIIDAVMAEDASLKKSFLGGLLGGYIDGLADAIEAKVNTLATEALALIKENTVS